MKTNKSFILREIAGENILVATGEAAQIFNGMITLNEVASFIWNNIDECKTVDKLIASILDEFDIDDETARRDIESFTAELIRMGMVIEE
ncbi:PqqD family protein [Intestinibacter bartlettii]|uniref:PqqD family protein n=1 Tax=Intestinibacter bartlettii TaxID=261299 RepID=UPI00319DA979